MKCELCEIVEKKLGLVFEDELVYAYLVPKPIKPGHIILTTKDHFPIIELIPEPTIKRIFAIANKLSICLFETMKIKGTNILINNGISAGQFHPHFLINIIPREEGDGLNFQWESKKLSVEDLSSIELKYKEFMNEKALETQSQQPIVNGDKPEEQPLKTNYLYKSLDRIP